MKLKVLYGLPPKVLFCKKTLMSNQRPLSAIEFNHGIKSKKETIKFNKNGISDTWFYSKKKKEINWKSREIELLKLLDKHRGKHGKYDCIVPGSGGKDSIMASHILKFEYGMNPITVTWPPILYTDYGYKNFQNWLSSGNLDNISAKRDEHTMKVLTKLSIVNLLHPFQTFMLGQKIFSARISSKLNIPLVFYGENEAEHGNNAKDNKKPARSQKYFLSNDNKNFLLGGVSVNALLNDYNLKIKNLEDFLPLKSNDIKEKKIEQHYLGYYKEWTPQEAFYYAVQKGNFRPRPFRTEGTYSKYNSIDDKIDDLHYWTVLIKFGYGRATCDVSQELRNDHLTIKEGKELIKKYDLEFPNRYFDEVMEYVGIKKKYFHKLCDRFRSPHIWKKTSGGWKLRHNCNYNGTDD
jgi:N-acetyl sugar amidotransferase